MSCHSREKGTVRKKALELTGQTFGRLKVVAKAPKPRHWICDCRCGQRKTVRADHLVSGRTQSCGCARVTHGHTSKGRHTPTYESWKAMKGRCKDTKVKSHGGRGITYDPRWEDFTQFLQDMGERPSGTTLDRLDVRYNYKKDNCQWGTDADQARNKRKVELLYYDTSERLVPGTHAEWARFLSNKTQKPWTSKALREVLKLLTLAQIINATSRHQLNASQLEEAAYKARMDELSREADALYGPVRRSNWG